MALDEALGTQPAGDGNSQLRDDLLAHYQASDNEPYSGDAAVLTERLSRKLAQPGSQPSVKPVDFSAEPEEKAPDLAKYGTPVESEPTPTTDDLSSFGTPVEPEAPPALGITGQVGAAAKGFLRAIPEQAGSMLQAGAAFAHTKPLPEGADDVLTDLSNSKGMSARDRAQLTGRAMRLGLGRDNMVEFGKAMRRIAIQGADPAAEATTLREKFGAQNAEAAKPITGDKLYQAGVMLKKNAAENVPMTPQEQSSVGGMFGAGVGGAIPYVLGAAVLGPEAAIAAGAVGMGLSTGGNAFEAAKLKGATDEQAVTAAGWGAEIGGALGAVPIGMVLRPVSQASPGMKSWLAAKLVQAAQGGITFASVGEAQEYLLQQTAKAYDKDAGYSPDAKRVIASFLSGGVLGVVVPLKPADIHSPIDVAEFLRRAAATRQRTLPGAEPMEGEVVPPRPGLPGPEGSSPEPGPEPGPGPTPRPGGGGAEATPPKTDHQQLRDAGFSDQEIAEMSPRVRAQRLAEAAPEQPPVKPSQPPTEQPAEPPAAETTGKRNAPVVATSVDDVLKASAVAVKPTPAQAQAGNYQHGHIELPHLGLEGKHGVSIETGVGETRTSHELDENGKPKWESPPMPVPYGRILGTKGADGDHLDIFIGPNPTSPHVFMIDQRNAATDKFDEHKILAGFDHPAGAITAYRDSYSDDATPRIGRVTAITADQFKEWLANGDHTKRFSEPAEWEGKKGFPEEYGITPPFRPSDEYREKVRNWEQDQEEANPENVVSISSSNNAAPVTNFKTAKGSTYQVGENGTTTRNKAARSDVGHEGDSGPKEQSAKTVYFDKQAINAFSIPENTRWRVIDHGDGTMSLATWNDQAKDWGISPGSRNIKYAEKPATGLHPLELWKPEKIKGLTAYKGMHPGNAITEVGTEKPAEAEHDVEDDEFDTFLRGDIKNKFAHFIKLDEEAKKNPDEPPSTEWFDAADDLVESFKLAGLPGDRIGHIQPIHSVSDIKHAFEKATPKQLDAYWLGESHENMAPRGGAPTQDELHATIESDPDYRHVADDVKKRAATIMADENLPLDDAIEQASMRLVSEDAEYGITPQLLHDTYGKGVVDEIQPKPASGNGHVAEPSGEGHGQPGEEEKAQGHGEHVPDHGAAGREEPNEVTSEHHQAIEDALGPMADKVLPVDIARAAEILAEKPEITPELAFQYAVIEDAVNQGFLTVPEAEKAYGPEVTEILGTGSEGAPRSGAHAEQGGTEPRQERAGGAKEGGELQGGGKAGSGAPINSASGKSDESDTTGAERPNAGSEAIPQTKQFEAAVDALGKVERKLAKKLGRELTNDDLDTNTDEDLINAQRAVVIASQAQSRTRRDDAYDKLAPTIGDKYRLVRTEYDRADTSAPSKEFYRDRLGLPDTDLGMEIVRNIDGSVVMGILPWGKGTDNPAAEKTLKDVQANKDVQSAHEYALSEAESTLPDGGNVTSLHKPDMSDVADEIDALTKRTPGSPEVKHLPQRAQRDLVDTIKQLAAKTETGIVPIKDIVLATKEPLADVHDALRAAAKAELINLHHSSSAKTNLLEKNTALWLEGFDEPFYTASIAKKEAAHGVSPQLPRSDAGPKSEAVPPPEGQRGADEAGAVEGAGGAPPVDIAAERGTESGERTAEPAGATGSGGTGQELDVRVPGRHGEPAPGRAEGAVRRNPAAGVKGENHVIEPGSLGEDRSPRVKAADNVRAIELAGEIISAARPASADEQHALSRYVGWGGLKGAFPDADGEFADGYEDVGRRLREILSPDEYDTARRSIQYAHYTAETVIRAMWGAARRLGFEGGHVFEPGMGVGHFAGMMPPDIAAHSQYLGVEMDHVTARIAGMLYPKYGVRNEDFTRMPLAENAFDLAIGNPPFADVSVQSDPKYRQGFLLHDYFFAKSIDAVRPGGLLMFVTSAGTMNKIDQFPRQYLYGRADLVGAIRLPSNAFKKNAGTEVTTDIVILRKRMPNEQGSGVSWTQTKEVELPGPDGKLVKGQVNAYFVDHPEMILGKQDFADKLYQGRYSVKAWDNFDLKDALAVAIAKLPRNVMKALETPTQRAEQDFESTEKKDGSYYLKGAVLHQMQGGAGVPVQRRGKGVEGGKTAEQLERIRGLVPIRDALRATYAADLEDNKPAGDKARKALNAAYDAFVGKFGPINKAEIQLRRPNMVQQEAARDEAREEARYAGVDFEEGTFNPSRMIDEGKTLAERARARKEARETAASAGRPFSEGAFDPEDMKDLILDKRPNIEPFMDDQESYRLRAIEQYDDASGKAAKGLVFSQNVITRQKPPEIKSVNDAALYVLNQEGRLDLDAIGALVKKTADETIEALGERIYRVPGTRDTWETKEQYLSGNVRKKLLLAQKEAQRDPGLRRNVEALLAAQPAPLAPAQISARLGMPWIPAKIIDQFAMEDLGLTKFRSTYIPVLAQWTVTGDETSVAAVTTHGTSRRNATALLQDALNHVSPKIYDEIVVDGRPGRQINPAATQEAQDKLAAIKERFAKWIFADEARADPLAAFYNENYNNLVVREFDGSYLTTPGISADWKWRPHQTRAIARIIQEGNTYVAHAVGAGKTSVYIGAAMEMRRLGLVKKPMIVVPNHMLAQFTHEFYAQYPTARIMVADDRNFHADRRKQFMANVALEDLDAVIITHTNFGMIPVSDEFNDEMIKTELDRYRNALAEIPKGQDARITRSRIEKQIERLEQRLSGKSNRRRDNVFTFDEMGVDFAFIDEAHEFRKLDFSTQMSNLKGITPEGSGKAWDLYVKSKLLEKRNPGRSLVLGSGTPITNTMAELFTVSRYLQPGELAERQLSAFDAWAGAFGEEVSELEQDAAGGYKPVSRFAKFVNVPELSSMVRQVMDVVTSRQLEQYVVRPQLKGGKRTMNLADKSVELERYQDSLAERMIAIKGRGKPEKGNDIMLTIIGDGRHAAIDMRLVGGDKSVTEPSKLDLLVGNVFAIWERTKRQKFYKPKNGAYDMSAPVDIGPATQMIFANLGLSGKRGLSVPDYIRAELVRRGVPRDQIALIGDYKNHVQKQKLFNDMNAGKVRVLIGSSAKMGTGVNAQRRLYANHNLDPLWYPADDEQRNGRIIRQGNWNPEVELHDYSTKGTYDSTMWGLMEKKARFIQGFFEGDPSMRDMEDLGEASQYAQAKAMTTNDPRLMRLTELKADLERAERRRAGFEQERYALKRKQAQARTDIDYYNGHAAGYRQDIARRKDITGDKFEAKVGKTTFDKRVEFGEAILKAIDDGVNKENVGRNMIIGEVSSFPIKLHVRKFMENLSADLYLERTGAAQTTIHGTSANGIAASVQAILSGFDANLEQNLLLVANADKFLKESAGKENERFKGMPEIERLSGEVRDLEAELSRKEEPKEPPPEQPLARAEERQLTPKAEAKKAELERMLTDVIRKMVGHAVQVQFHADMIPTGDRPLIGWGDEVSDAVKKTGIYGAYFPARHLIQISLAGVDPTTAAFHEAYHSIEHLLQTAREHELMLKETPRIRKLLRKMNSITENEEKVLAGSEVRAIGMEIYRHQVEAHGKGAAGFHIGAKRWYQRVIDMTYRVRNGLNGLGFQIAEDIYRKAYEGEFADQIPIFTKTYPEDMLAQARQRNPHNAPLRDSVGAAMESTSLKDKIVERAQDLSRPVEKLQQVIEARLAGELPDSQAFYQKKRLFPGKLGAEVQDFSRLHLDPLFKMLKARGLTMDQAGDLAYAMHAAERNRQMDLINEDGPFEDMVRGRGSGLSNAEADKILALYPQSLKDEVARRISGINDYIHNMMVMGGLETQDTIDAWNAMYSHYVDLSGWEDAPEEAPSGHFSGGNFNVRGPEVRSAFGRRSKANNPLANLIDQAYRTIERAKKNEYKQAVDNALHELEPDDLKNFVRFDRGKPKKEINRRTGLVRVVEDSNYRNEPGAVAFKRGGATKYIIFENVQLAEAINRMHADGLEWTKPLLVLQNKLKSLWTHYSPNFLVLHFVFRYPIEGFLNSFEQGARNVPRYMAESFPFFGDASRAIFATNRGEVHANPRIAQMQQYWEEMRKAGGSMTFRSMRDIDLLREHLDTAVKSLAKGAWSSVQQKRRAFVEGMDVVTNALDNALRLAAYAAARRNGKTPEQAALIGREATVDFQLAGQWKNRAGLIFPFGNIAVQTGARMVKAVARSRVMQGIFAATVMAGFLSTMFNYLVGGDDSDGVPFMDKIPEWERRLNFTVLNPFHRDDKGRPVPIHIPMPYNWAMPMTLGSAMASMIFSKNKHSIRSMLAMVTKSAMEVMTPFGQEENLAAVLAPEVLRPAIHIYTNKDYNGIPVHPDSTFQDRPNAYFGRKTTGDGWKFIAQGVNDLTGGTRHHSGALDFYPEDLRTIFDYPLGSQRRFIDNTVNTVGNAIQGKPTDYSHIPLSRVIMGTDYDAADRNRKFERAREQRYPYTR